MSPGRGYVVVSPNADLPDPEGCVLSPWVAADQHILRVGSPGRKPGGCRLASYQEDGWNVYAAPSPLDGWDLAARYQDRGAAQALAARVRGGWRSSSFLLRSLGYREAVALRRTEYRPPVDSVCMLWPDARQTLEVVKLAAANLWARNRDGAWRHEPHAAILRAQGPLHQGPPPLDGLKLLRRGIVDDLWNLGFPDVPEAANFPLLSGIPYLVGIGFLPLGVQVRGPETHVYLYDAAEK